LRQLALAVVGEHAHPVLEWGAGSAPAGPSDDHGTSWYAIARGAPEPGGLARLLRAEPTEMSMQDAEAARAIRAGVKDLASHVERARDEVRSAEESVGAKLVTVLEEDYPPKPERQTRKFRLKNGLSPCLICSRLLRRLSGTLARRPLRQRTERRSDACCSGFPLPTGRLRGNDSVRFSLRRRQGCGR
jgi:hypothetical protein